MPKLAELEGAFDTALRQVQRSISWNENLRRKLAQPQLETLETELRRERAKALKLGTVDREWLQKSVRSVVEWVSLQSTRLASGRRPVYRTDLPAFLSST